MKFLGLVILLGLFGCATSKTPQSRVFSAEKVRIIKISYATSSRSFTSEHIRSRSNVWDKGVAQKQMNHLAEILVRTPTAKKRKLNNNAQVEVTFFFPDGYLEKWNGIYNKGFILWESGSQKGLFTKIENRDRVFFSDMPKIKIKADN